MLPGRIVTVGWKSELLTLSSLLSTSPAFSLFEMCTAGVSRGGGRQVKVSVRPHVVILPVGTSRSWGGWRFSRVDFLAKNLHLEEISRLAWN